MIFYALVTGAQLGGFNRAQEPVTGLQAGALNESRSDLTGAQIGAGNYAEGQVRGAQLGAVNISHGMSGIQLGVVNIATDMNGLQLGFFNKSRGKSTLPIGLINIVEDGVYRLGYAFSERKFHQLQFRHGSENSYSVLQYGQRFSDDSNGGFQLLGIGFGGQWTSEKMFVGLEGVFNYVNRSGTFERPAWLTQLRLLPGWRITRGISVSVGPTLNHVFNEGNAFPAEFDPQRRFWIGYHAGLEIWL